MSLHDKIKTKKTTKIGVNYCTDCGNLLSVSENAESEGGPSAGDISICSYCGEIMIFTNEKVMRSAYEQEKTEIICDLSKRMPETWQKVVSHRKIYLAKKNAKLN